MGGAASTPEKGRKSEMRIRHADWAIPAIPGGGNSNLASSSFEGIQFEPGNLLEDEDDSKEAEEQEAPTSPSKVALCGPPKPKTLKVFNSIDLRSPRLLGEGGFGRVMEVSIQGKRVATKVFRAPLIIEDALKVIRPLMGLKHRNLVKIKGIVTTTTSKGLVSIEFPQLLLEFFPEGNLLQFLSRKDNPQDYAMLGKLALDIVHGGEYLHGKHVIHGNLAARNVMIEKAVSKQKTHYNAKIADYGVTRLSKGSGDNYLTLPSGKIVPIRWVPREIVVNDANGTTYTYASDVWSFGIVLWEMWTKGAIPYGATYSNVHVVELLKNGKSPLDLYRPKGCPTHIVEVMESILKVNPSERPKFGKLKEDFEDFKLKSKAKKKDEQGEGSPTKKAAAAIVVPHVECKKTDGPSTPEVKKEVKTALSFSKVEDDKSSQSQEKPKKPENSGVAQKQFKEEVKPSTPRRRHGSDRDRDLKQGGQLQKQKQSSDTRGRGGGGRYNPPARGQSHQGHGHGPRIFHGNSVSRTPNAPPPYTPSPLPFHSAYSGPGVGASGHGVQMGYGFPPPPPGPTGKTDYDTEIKKRQNEISMLEVQKVTDEIQQRASELTDALQRAATLGINTAAGTGANPFTIGAAGANAPRSYAMEHPSQQRQGPKQSRGGVGRGHGRGHVRGGSGKPK